MQSHFEIINERAKLFLKISNIRVPLSNIPVKRDPSVHNSINSMLPPPVNLVRNSNMIKDTHLTGISERLVEEYAPDCIILNDIRDAIHVYGDVSDYTKGVRPGKISNNIKDMVVDDLNVAISTALYRCEKNEQDVYYKDIVIKKADDTQLVIDISIFLVKSSETPNAQRFFIVQFIRQEATTKKLSKLPKIAFNVDEQSTQRIRDLELELVKKQEHLQVTVEELETTNEELQSTNEELMSSNEELQSTNEELQSVNEELYTVNSEYQEKISELTEVNNDLDSIFNATDIGIIFLNDQLTIRKFTDSASQYVNLRYNDVGRPFHHISHDLIYDELLNDIADVSANGKIIEKCIRSQKGRTLLVKISPYRREKYHDQDGVLITITNISRLSFVEQALMKAQEQIRNSVLDKVKLPKENYLEQKPIHILLLDDNSADRIHIKRLLENNSRFVVQDFGTVDTASASAHNNDFDIFLLGYRLNDNLTAKDFIARIKQKNSDTPVVILSGYSDADMNNSLVNSDVFDFLNKDELTSQLLVKSIDYVLEKKSIQNTLEELST